MRDYSYYTGPVLWYYGGYDDHVTGLGWFVFIGVPIIGIFLCVVCCLCCGCCSYHLCFKKEKQVIVQTAGVPTI